MNKNGLSKSKYCKGVQCKKILWLSKYKSELAKKENNDAILESGRKVGEFAKGLFGDYIDVLYDDDSVMIEKTGKLLEDKPNIITEATFSYDDNLCRVDILKNDVDGVEIYEVKSSTKIKEIFLDDIAYQYFVLSNLGLTVKKACIIHLNNKTYVRGKELDINQLFDIVDLTDIVWKKQDEIKDKIDEINSFMEIHGEDNEPQIDLGIHCCEPYHCVFWQYCSHDLPENNVFDLKGRMWKSTKFKKYHEGKISFEELQNDNLSERYLEQIDFELNNREPKIDKDAIKEVLDSLKYPLYFLDYETINPAIPEFEGTKAYQQIPFQYSLHIKQEEGAPLEHKEFLAEVNDENMIRNFAESMVNNIPEDGSVIVYNQKFEKSLVNEKLAEMYPDLNDEIERINDNMVDFMVPFEKRKYYTKEMKGSHSIKYVLPALFPDDSKLDYSKLQLIHKGDEASNAFLTLKDQTPEKQKEIRDALLKYCELDTYALVKIWEKFKEVINEN